MNNNFAADDKFNSFLSLYTYGMSGLGLLVSDRFRKQFSICFLAKVAAESQEAGNMTPVHYGFQSERWLRFIHEEI